RRRRSAGSIPISAFSVRRAKRSRSSNWSKACPSMTPRPALARNWSCLHEEASAVTAPQSIGPRQRLRAILAGDRCVHPASVYDPVTICMAQDLGFELAMLGGSVAALAVLGAPDIGLLTLSEFAGLCRRICRASPMPLFVD